MSFPSPEYDVSHAPRSAFADVLARVSPALATGGRRLVRIALPVPDLDPLAWLSAQEDDVKVYWSGRHADHESAGIGVADVFAPDADADYDSLLERVRSAILAGDEGVRYYGGIAFDRKQPHDGRWEAFGSYRFWLPRFELQREGGATKLICNLAFPDDEADLKRILSRLDDLPLSPIAVSRPEHGTPAGRADTPPHADWIEAVQWALESFEQTRLRKVVLARRSTFTFDSELDALALLHRVKASTPECFHFYFQPGDGSAFIGATPERLYSRHGRRIETEAVASTRPRGATPSEDEQLAQDLLSSDKDVREHEFVRRSISAAIAPYCATFHQDRNRTVMRLAKRMHLLSRFRGTLRDDVSDADLLRALHPTPAVGGYPTTDALRSIAALEGFDRGWYAGPVGWAGADDAEFAVGIRSALVRGRDISLFSGAGIVAGSDPESEWAEIEQKIADFTERLS